MGQFCQTCFQDTSTSENMVKFLIGGKKGQMKKVQNKGNGSQTKQLHSFMAIRSKFCTETMEFWQFTRWPQVYHIQFPISDPITSDPIAPLQLPFT